MMIKIRKNRHMMTLSNRFPDERNTRAKLPSPSSSVNINHVTTGYHPGFASILLALFLAVMSNNGPGSRLEAGQSIDATTVIMTPNHRVNGKSTDRVLVDFLRRIGVRGVLPIKSFDVVLLRSILAVLDPTKPLHQAA